ncbi:hypothetical protein GCM10010210_11100 [Pseudonocardia hydrocarbonoxydans]|uniref:Head-to-tail stopper n=1 Tax=Pseudonocardia hydrocarbonoxydans TaxID=76726 RepID=A0A4Y3WVW1_9PSEU|nr:hypothetical protein PHY01_41520 [Pseudonocardia hydrocarbonoxydans]
MLDRGNADVVLFPEVTITDPDGNTITRPATAGIPARATVQPLGSTTDDQDGAGFVTGPTRYRLRLTRSYAGPVLGRQSRVEWNGDRYAVLGDPVHFTGSRKTAHTDYVIGRA